MELHNKPSCCAVYISLINKSVGYCVLRLQTAADQISLLLGAAEFVCLTATLTSVLNDVFCTKVFIPVSKS